MLWIQSQRYPVMLASRFASGHRHKRRSPAVHGPLSSWCCSAGTNSDGSPSTPVAQRRNRYAAAPLTISVSHWSLPEPLTWMRIRDLQSGRVWTEKRTLHCTKQTFNIAFGVRRWVTFFMVDYEIHTVGPSGFFHCHHAKFIHAKFRAWNLKRNLCKKLCKINQRKEMIVKKKDFITGCFFFQSSRLILCFAFKPFHFLQIRKYLLAG